METAISSALSTNSRGKSGERNRVGVVAISKNFFLLFTKELIRHSEKQDIIKLQKIIEWEEGKKKENMPSTFEVKQNIPEARLKELKEETKTGKGKPMIKQIVSRIAQPVSIPVSRPIPRRPLVIPEPKLPSHLEYLQPIPSANVEIDLPKINPLIKDPAVRTIEGNPGENAIVTGTMGIKPTNIFLSKDDIDAVINKFSEASKIPATEGIYRVVVGNLIFSGIISEVIGSRFVIRKMISQPNPSFAPRPNAFKKNNSPQQRFF